MNYNSINNSDIDYKKYEEKFRSLYPRAYKLFFEFESEEKNYLNRCIQFFSKFHIEVRVGETKTITSKYKGTFDVKIKVKDEEIRNKLKIDPDGFNSYGHANNENATHKGLMKGFNVIECLVSGRTIPKKPRSKSKLKG